MKRQKIAFAAIVLLLIFPVIVGSAFATQGFNYEAYLSANPDLPSDWGKADCITHYHSCPK